MGPRSRGSQVRVKRCGKSAPACGAIRTARSTPLGARSSRRYGLLACQGSPRHPSGRSHRGMVTRTHRVRQNPAYRATHYHHPSPGPPSESTASIRVGGGHPSTSAPPGCTKRLGWVVVTLTAQALLRLGLDVGGEHDHHEAMERANDREADASPYERVNGVAIDVDGSLRGNDHPRDHAEDQHDP